MLERWTSGVIKNRLLVFAIWIVVTILGLLASANLNDRLTTSLTVPGSQSAKADELLARHFNENIEGTFTVFYRFKNATKLEIQEFENHIALASQVIPKTKVLQSRAVAGTLLVSIGTPYDLPHAAAFTSKLREAIVNQGLDGAQVTGPPAIKFDVTPELSKDLHRGELVAVVIGFLLLILVLGFSWAAIIPIILATATIATTLGIIFLLSHYFLMVLYIPNIVELIGLGLAIDYSLLMVQRFRKEVLTNPTDLAINETMKTAGRTVTISGLTVALGLAALMLVRVPFIQSLGMAGVLVPLISIIAALTLQPALLSYLGSGGVRSFGFKGLLHETNKSRNFFSRISRFVIAKPILVFIGSLTLLAIAASPILALRVTPSSLTAIPSHLESAKPLNFATSSAGEGAITPHEIIIDLGNPHSAEAADSARLNLATAISQDKEVFLVANGKESPYIDSSGRFMRMYVIGKHDLGSDQTNALMDRIREKYFANSTFSMGTKFYLGGAPAQGNDLLKRIYGAFPFIVGFILILVYFILYLAFRSVVLPLKAIALDLISVLVSFSVVVLVFRYGIGSALLGTYHLQQIEAWVLVFLFAILFGLSMDYEVFIVSRIREAWDRGESNNDAIAEGLSRTGGVVTAAAAILIVAVSGLANGHFAGLQQLGVGLAFGIFIDATIIRMFLLPSTMVLLGKWNWWTAARNSHK